MNRLLALAFALLAPAAALAAWTPAGTGLEALALPGARPTHLAMPGTGSSAAPSGAAPRVLVVADESPEGLRFVDLDAGVELGTLSLPYQPVALAVDSAGSRAYVLTDDQSLHVVDIATRALLSTFVLGGSSKSLLVREASGQVVEVLVAQKGPDRVVGIDPANGATLRSVDLDRNPAALAWGVGGTRVLVGAKSGKLYTLDAADLSVVATTQIGDEIRHLAWWEAGGLAVVVHKRTDGMSLVNVATGQVSAFVALDGDPERSAVDAASARTYVTTHDDFSVNRVNLAGQVLEGRYALPEKAAGAVFDPLSAKLLVSQRGDRRLLRLDPAQASLISILQLNKRLRDIAVNDATHEAVAVADKADELTRIKLADLSAAVVALPARPRYVAVDSALNLAVVGHKNKTLRFVDTAQSPPVLLADTVTLAEEPDALAVDSDRNLTVALTDSKRKIHFVSNVSKTLLSSISLSEDADALALHAGRGLAYVLTDKKKLLLVDLDTRAVVQTIGLEFRGNAIAIDEARDRAVLTTDQGEKAYVLDLAALTPMVTNLVEANFAQVHVLPRKPGAVKIQRDTGLAVVASKESNALSSIDLGTGSLSSGFATLDKPFALAISSHFNQALVLGAETDEISIVQLASTAPLLSAIVPASALADAQPKVLSLTGQYFAGGASVLFGATALPATFVSSTSLSVTVPGILTGTPGIVQLAVVNPGNQASNSLPFTLTPALAINGLSPASGTVGTLVTILGTGFDVIPGNNLLTFRGINNTTVPGTALSATSTQITVRVPPLAETGPITLSNSLGTVQSPVFAVTREQDFQLVVSPASLTAYQSASNSAQVQISSTGTAPFTGLVALSVQGLPPGVTASFSPAATLSAFQTGTISFSAAGAAAPGNYPLTVQGVSSEGGEPFVRSAIVNLTVGASGGVTGIKGRFVTPENRGIAGVIVRADTEQNPQPQTTTDAAGNFVLVGLPAGPVTFRFDATPANPLYPIWPHTTTLVANQIAVVPDWTIAPPPSDDKFTPIQANSSQDQIITDPRYPGVEIKIPAGTTIVGWDGVPKSRIAVERLDPDKLPVSAPPISTKSVYQLYFGTPMGGLPSQPIPVTLPNDIGLDPGSTTELWYYDGSPMGGTGQWLQGGSGTVSADGQTIVTNPGSGIPRFCGVCGLPCFKNNQSGGGSAPPPGQPDSKCANTVSLPLGQELAAAQDHFVDGVVPLSVNRAFSPRDPYSNIAGTTLSLGLGWMLNYDITLLPFNAQQTRIVMPGNARVDFVPDGAGKFESRTDSRFYGAKLDRLSSSNWELRFKDGRTWKFQQFGLIHWLVEQLDTNGNSLLVTRNASGKITKAVGGERALEFSYGGNGFISAVSDQLQRSVQFTYTPANRIQSVTAPDGRVTQYGYVDDSEFPALAACPLPTSGGVRIKSILRPGRSNPIVQDYGPGFRVLRETQEDGAALRFAYSVVGACVTHVSNTAVRCTANCPTVDSWENYQAGWRIVGGDVMATTTIDDQGRSITQRFGNSGLGKQVEDAQGQAYKYTRDLLNRITAITDPLGRVWQYTYDAKGNRTSETDPSGKVTEYTYDATWNKLTTITRYDDANQPVTQTYAYDATSGNLVRSTDPLGNPTTFTYNTKGQLTSVTDALNRTSALTYNGAGDLVSIRDALGNETELTTDLVGRVTAITDALRNKTTTAYNETDQATEVVNALQGSTRYSYGGRRELESITNPRDYVVESYIRDDRLRLVQKIDAKSKAQTYTYNSTGQVESITDRKGQVTLFTYDDSNRVTRIQYPDGERRLVYDAVGRVSSVSETPGATVSYSYNSNDQVVQETQENGGLRTVIGYEFDALGRRFRRTVDGADPTEYAYDRASRLTSITYRGAATTYEWDAVGRLTRKVLPNGIVQSIGYDDLDRTTSITYSRPDGSTVEAVSYTYDARGQRTTRTTGSAEVPETPFVASYDEANRMTSVTFNPGTGSAKAFDLSYDDNGNLASRVEVGNASNATTYSWDSRNRLVGIQSPENAASFKYDALNRRVERVVNGQTTQYVYDGPQAVVEITNGQPEPLLSGLDVDEVIARYSQSGRTTYLQDALNSVIARTNDDASVEGFYSYSPYGETQVLGPDGGNSIRYTGREHDDTGLYYYRARYFDPVLKRFLSEDPIGVAGGLNLYGYVGGDPVNLIDPTGNASTCYSAGPGCSGAGTGIVKTPPSGGCYSPIWAYGAIVDWKPCTPPQPAPPSQPPQPPVCPGTPPSPPPPSPAPPTPGPGSDPGADAQGGATPMPGTNPCSTAAIIACTNNATKDLLIRYGEETAAALTVYAATHAAASAQLITASTAGAIGVGASTVSVGLTVLTLGLYAGELHLCSRLCELQKK